MGPAATQQKSKTFSPSSGRMLYPLVVRLCHALHYPSLSQAGEVTGLQAQLLGVDFDVVLAELGRKTPLAQRRGAGPYERSQHGQRGSKLRMWHLLKILSRLELGVMQDIARGSHREQQDTPGNGALKELLFGVAHHKALHGRYGAFEHFPGDGAIAQLGEVKAL